MAHTDTRNIDAIMKTKEGGSRSIATHIEFSTRKKVLLRPLERQFNGFSSRNEDWQMLSHEPKAQFRIADKSACVK